MKDFMSVCNWQEEEPFSRNCCDYALFVANITRRCTANWLTSVSTTASMTSQASPSHRGRKAAS